MLDEWQVAKNHCIERDGKKSNRGWKRVKLSDAGEPEFGLQAET
jgi:hypothetical protein